MYGYTIGEECLISAKGTIIPQAVGFANETLLASYHTGADGYFSPVEMSFSKDAGASWEEIEHPLHRITSLGKIAEETAIFFDGYLFKIGKGKYTAFFNKTFDSGSSFTVPELAVFYLDEVAEKTYVPRSKDDPDYFVEPEIPEFYRKITDVHGAIIAGHIWGPVIRCPDNSLGIAVQVQMKNGMTRKPMKELYVKRRGNEPAEDTLFSSIFFRSEDKGKNWQQVATIAECKPGCPFDVGILYSEGFTETAMSCASGGDIFAIIRHGSYHLLWSARSHDNGNNWNTVEPLNYPGVAPSMAMMPNGVLVAAWGRPGMTMGFNLDGTGKNWDLLIQIMDDAVPSQKNPWVLPIGKNRVLLFYDRREWDSVKKQHYNHGIYSREIEFFREK